MLPTSTPTTVSDSEEGGIGESSVVGVGGIRRVEYLTTVADSLHPHCDVETNMNIISKNSLRECRAKNSLRECRASPNAP